MGPAPEAREQPPALKWVEPFVHHLNRAVLEGLWGWELREDVDPLRWRLQLRFKEPVRTAELPFIREALRAWAAVNSCVYRRSEVKGRDFYALIVLKGLRPEQNNNPFDHEVQPNGNIRRAR